MGNGRNPALSHRFLCAVSHASSSEATRGRSGAHGCVRGQPLHARVAQRKRVRTSGLQAGHPRATSSIACVHGHGCTKPCCRRCPTCRAHRNAAVHRAEPTRGLTRTAPVPTAAAPGVHRRWVGSSARPHLTPQPRALSRCKMRALPKPRHSRELSLHGDPSGAESRAHKTQRTSAGSHARVRPAPQTQSPGWGPPSQCGCGWSPPRLRGGPSAAGMGSDRGGGFYPAALQTKRPPRAAPPGRAAGRSARDPKQRPRRVCSGAAGALRMRTACGGSTGGAAYAAGARAVAMATGLPRAAVNE